jgi:hypothetical protein
MIHAAQLLKHTKKCEKKSYDSCGLQRLKAANISGLFSAILRCSSVKYPDIRLPHALSCEKNPREYLHLLGVANH